MLTAPDYAWLILVLVINAYWLIYDWVLCRAYHWVSMTGQMRHYLHETVLGPLIFGLLVAVPGIFLYHIFQSFTRQR